MAKIVRSLLYVGVLLICCASAWAAPTISWTDAAGSHQVDLILMANPDYNASDPYAAEGMMVWAPTGSWFSGYQNGYIKPLDIDMASVNQMSFAGTGNFMGPDEMGEMKVWKQIKIKQQIKNSTSVSWTDFHMSSSGARFYKVWQNYNGWDVTQMSYTCDFYGNGSAPVAPGQVFYDGIDLKLSTPDVYGNASFTVLKWPSYVVPEPGSILALMSGMIGLAAFARRRKA